MSRRNRSRGWCFTINNYTDDDILEILYMHDNAEYTVFGFEVGKKGTPHIQGYTYFRNQISFSTIKELLTRANIRAARGNADQNYDYCSKDNDFYEFGDRPSQGSRSDIDDLKEDILNGSSLKEVSLTHTNLYMRYSGAIEKFILLHKETNDECTVYHANKDNYQAVCDYFWENTLEIDDPKLLTAYDDQDAVIFTCGMNVYLLTQFLRNKPAIIKAGWQDRRILPKVVVFYDKYWKEDMNTYGYLVNKLPDDIPTDDDYGTNSLSQKCLGNTSPDPSEELIEEIKNYSAFEKEAIYEEAKKKGTYGGMK